MELRSSNARALDGSHRVGRDEALLHGLPQSRAEHAAGLGDRRRRQSSSLHTGQHRPDVSGTDAGDLETSDEGRDLSADVALVRLQSQRPNPSGALICDPSRQVVSEPDPLGTGISPSFEVSDEFPQRAFRLFLRREPALALLAPFP